LTRSGLRVRIQDQPFQLLAFLLERPGEVVTRDEIRQNLWSADTYVAFDDGLNTAMKKLRAALGDGADNPRFIETIPRRGYRFVAPVSFPISLDVPPSRPETKDASATKAESTSPTRASATVAPAPVDSIPPSKTVRGWTGTLVVALVIGLAVYLFRSGPVHAPDSDASLAAASSLDIKPRPSVAVLGFRNVSRNPDEAWISTALAEMLNTELAAGDRLRLVPGEQLAHTELNLSSSEMESLGKESLHRLKANVGADFVVLGSYTAVGQPRKRRIRLDLRLQNTNAGETTGEDSVTGSEDDFFDLVSEAGTRLRQRFDAGTLASDQAVQVRASLPGNVQAARLYAEGLAKQRLSDSLAARDLLQQAIGADPKYPMSHSALADAWSDLGYDARAQEEAKLAFDLSAHTSSQEHLLAEGRYREAAREWPQAMEIYRNLSRMFPDNLDYGLRLASAQISAGQGKDALETVTSLRQLRFGAGTDPRIDLQESIAAQRLGDFERAQRAAAAAAAKGRSLQARFMIAEARSGEGWDWDRLGQYDKAQEALDEAKALFSATGDHHNTAVAINLMGDLLYDKGDMDGARKALNESLAMCRKYGFQKCAARSLNALGHIQVNQGNLQRARASYEEVLRINRESGVRAGVGSALSNIGNILQDLGDMSGAKKYQEESLQVYTEIGDKRGMGATLGNLGNLLDDLGELPAAIDCYQRAYKLDLETGYKRGFGFVLSGWGRVLMEQRQLQEARLKLEDALRIRKEMANPDGIADSLVALAQLALEENRLPDAEKLARDAATQFAQVKSPEDEAIADATLARSLLAQNKQAEARTVSDQAEILAQKTTFLQPRFESGMTRALVQAADGKPADARKQLDTVLAQTKSHGFAGYELATRLQLALLARRTSGASAGKAELALLERDARSHGFLLIAGKAAASLTASH
jgi:tetratricopeptide (TPR) repeat protein/DNA-binding winged helix-turn-helix (wHTH) protein